MLDLVTPSTGVLVHRIHDLTGLGGFHRTGFDLREQSLVLVVFDGVGQFLSLQVVVGLIFGQNGLLLCTLQLQLELFDISRQFDFTGLPVVVLKNLLAFNGTFDFEHGLFLGNAVGFKLVLSAVSFFHLEFGELIVFSGTDQFLVGEFNVRLEVIQLLRVLTFDVFLEGSPGDIEPDFDRFDVAFTHIGCVFERCFRPQHC